jgi:hypothetical protein
MDINDIIQNQADITFTPIVGQKYYLYQRDPPGLTYYVSPFEPDGITWGRSPDPVSGSDRDYYKFISAVKKNADGSWESA